jgi:hypothetical protein
MTSAFAVALAQGIADRMSNCRGRHGHGAFDARRETES